ncbi:MAG: hypothetical protein KBD76_11225 [Bacteriovorax sp.]|nr:hypothetical protein [Bacteriovorax sp.]
MKTILFALLLLCLSLPSFAVVSIKTKALALLETDRDYVFEVQTSKFQKVILDCASFINEIVFYEEKKALFRFYLEGDDCQRMYDILADALEKKYTACFEIESDVNTLNVTLNENCH